MRWTKFDKTRRLPLHPSTTEALGVYLAHPDRPRTNALFCSPGGSRLIYCNVHSTFRTLRTKARLEPKTPTCRPRIHDLRHALWGKGFSLGRLATEKKHSLTLRSSRQALGSPTP